MLFNASIKLLLVTAGGHTVQLHETLALILPEPPPAGFTQSGGTAQYLIVLHMSCGIIGGTLR